jgi:hypothetical protein
MARDSKKKNRYYQIIEAIFRSKYTRGKRTLDFEREDLTVFAKELGIALPKNLGDVIYSFRYRSALPDCILDVTPSGEIWIIRPAGRGKYRFVLVKDVPLIPDEAIGWIKVPEATPEIVAKYALGDEQALLARVRYNRLLDIFTGVACYSLQNHLRSSVAEVGQVETDELYVGVDRRGMHYAFPVQAKGGRDRLNVVQIEQDIALCAAKFPTLVCRPIAVQFMQDEIIAVIELEQTPDGIRKTHERHYKLVSRDQITAEDLSKYRLGSDD